MRYTLYRIVTCPFCVKVQSFMEESGIEFEAVDVDPWDRSLVIEVSKQAQVPVLIDGQRNEVVPDSAQIIEYLKSQSA